MRTKPVIFDEFLKNLADSINLELGRRGLEPKDIGMRTNWGTSRTRDLKRFLGGDLDAIGLESALRAAAAIGLTASIVRPAMQPRHVRRIAA